jgi:hypothetical protein
MACYSALGNTKIPRVEIVAGENGEEPEIELDDDMDNSIRINLHSLPVITSVSQVSKLSFQNSSSCNESVHGVLLQAFVEMHTSESFFSDYGRLLMHMLST